MLSDYTSLDIGCAPELRFDLHANDVHIILPCPNVCERMAKKGMEDRNREQCMGLYS